MPASLDLQRDRARRRAARIHSRRRWPTWAVALVLVAAGYAAYYITWGTKWAN